MVMISLRSSAVTPCLSSVRCITHFKDQSQELLLFPFTPPEPQERIEIFKQPRILILRSKIVV